MYKLKKISSNIYVRIIAAIAIIALIITLSMYLLTLASKSYENENINTAKTALQRAAISCYSIEGFYPPSVDYLKEHYGLTIDEKKYIIVYEVFSENIMPDMDILSTM